jgi:hypothetical protein
MVKHPISPIQKQSLILVLKIPSLQGTVPPGMVKPHIPDIPKQSLMVTLKVPYAPAGMASLERRAAQHISQMLSPQAPNLLSTAFAPETAAPATGSTGAAEGEAGANETAGASSPNVAPTSSVTLEASPRPNGEVADSRK